MATSPRPGDRSVAALWVEQELPFPDLDQPILTGSRRGRDGDRDEDDAESIPTRSAEPLLRVKEYTVEHGKEKADRYLLALRQVLDEARLRQLNEAQGAKGPVA